MTPAERIRRLREKGEFHFTKSLGQNFLVDENILRKLLAVSDLSKEDHIIEIGAGAGVLTEAILSVAGKVLAVEIDKSLIPFLADTLGHYPQLTLWHEDALTAPLNDWIRDFSPDRQVKVLGNLPYCVTTPIVMKLLQEVPRISLMVFMVQQEVAARMAAQPGTKAYGSLSVAVQTYGRAETCFSVSPGSFFPSPAVSSAVVKIEPHRAPPARIDDPALYFALVRAAFGQRRKTLANALTAFRPEAGKSAVIKVLHDCHIDPGRRGETLAIREFAALSRAWKAAFLLDAATGTGGPHTMEKLPPTKEKTMRKQDGKNR